MAGQITEEQSKAITVLLNGTKTAIKNVVPIEHTVSKPNVVKDAIYAKFGVLIGITGDLKGKIILSGQPKVFADIGKTMFGTEISGEMLNSFSGELGNMVAGNLSTDITSEGIQVDITAPSIMEGEVKISGFVVGICLNVDFAGMDDLDIYLMLD